MLRKLVVSVLILVVGVGILMAQDMVMSDGGGISAEGDGTFALNGSGTVTISGDGLLFIVDRTGDASIDIEATKRFFHKEREKRGNVVHTYRRFEGTALISGDDIAVVLQGINIQALVSGTGVMLLEGVGEYTIDTQVADWSSDGVMIELGEIPR